MRLRVVTFEKARQTNLLSHLRPTPARTIAATVSCRFHGLIMIRINAGIISMLLALTTLHSTQQVGAGLQTRWSAWGTELF